MKTKTKEEFLELAKKKHGNKYNYDKVNYIDYNTDVIISCPKHGDFLQKPRNHVKYGGCIKCKNESTSLRCRKTTEQFIKEAQEVHGNLYSYEKSNYIGGHKPITITCQKHGDFEQDAVVHLGGHGCPKCAKESIAEQFRFSTEDFITRTKEIHGDEKYDYSKVQYKNYLSGVKIICPEHGEFTQTPRAHISCGCGCPKCTSSVLENKLRLFFDKNKILTEEQKTWDWLVYDRNQRVDFYLPEYNIIIECQGEQHFEEVDRFKYSLKEVQIRDQNKKKLCEEHGICVLYFSNLSTKNKKYQYPYTVYEDLEELLQIIKQIGLTNQFDNKQ